MVKNVIIVNDYGYIEGGASRIAHETALALKEQGLNVIFFCAVSPVSNELKNAGIEVICLNQDDILHEKSRIKGALRGINNKKAKKEFALLLDKFEPNETVIHVHTWTKGVSNSIFPVAKKKQFKVVITVHDYFLTCPNGGLFNYKKRCICEIKPMSLKCLTCNCDSRRFIHKIFRVLRQWKQNRNIRKSDSISYIFISEFSKREFCKRYNKIPESKQYFLPNLINFPKDRVRVTCEHNDVYLFIGGITEVKGIRLFCEAVTQANVNAIVIGQGILREELEFKYPNIEFVGWKSKEEMTPYLQKTRCLVFPSIWYETMGLTALECLSVGVPVICSNLCSASEYINENSNGFIYNGDSTDDLINRLKISLDDDIVERLSNEAFRLFDESLFSKDKYISDLNEIYEEIMKDAR